MAASSPGAISRSRSRPSTQPATRSRTGSSNRRSSSASGSRCRRPRPTRRPAPAIGVAGTQLTGDLRAFGASWNRGHFNQGSPKPDGTKPGQTSGPNGSYDPATQAFTLTWTSLIVGGPFNGFTGSWHFAGTFEPVSSVTTAAAPAPAASLAPVAASSGGTLAHTGNGAGLVVVGVLLALVGASMIAGAERRPRSRA